MQESTIVFHLPTDIYTVIAWRIAAILKVSVSNLTGLPVIPIMLFRSFLHSLLAKTRIIT